MIKRSHDDFTRLYNSWKIKITLFLIRRYIHWDMLMIALSVNGVIHLMVIGSRQDKILLAKLAGTIAAVFQDQQALRAALATRGRSVKIVPKMRIGTRESRLAVVQAQLLAAEIRRSCKGIEPELVTMKTTGDRILDRALESSPILP